MGKVWRFLLDLAGILSLVVPLVVGFLAWLQQIPWYLIALSIIATAVLIIVGINQFETWRERHKKRFSQFTDTEIEESVYKWIDIPEFPHERIAVKKDEAFFGFRIIDQAERHVYILRMREQPHFLLFEGEVPILPPPEIREKLGESGIKILANEIGLELLRLGYGHEFVPISSGFCVRIVNSVFIDDSLNETTFRHQGAQMSRAIALVIGIVASTWQGLGFDVPAYYEKKSNAETKNNQA